MLLKKDTFSSIRKREDSFCLLRAEKQGLVCRTGKKAGAGSVPGRCFVPLSTMKGKNFRAERTEGAEHTGNIFILQEEHVR